MDRKILIVITLLFMLVIAGLLFFTVLEIKTGEKPSIKIGSITGSTVAVSNQPVYSEENDYFIKRKICRN